MKKFLILAIMVLTLLVPTSVMAANPVPMTTTTVAQVASITVDVPNLNFVNTVNGGSVVIGTYSAVLPIIITNSGNIPITVTAVVGGADASFFNNSLQLDSGGGYFGVGSWSYTTPIAPIGTLHINSRILPTQVITGAAATLTFVATPSVPTP